MPDTLLNIDGRLLFLTCDPAALVTQLGGHDLDPEAAIPLRDDVSTDEISPVAAMSYFDDRLGEYPYTGLVVEGRRPIAVGAVRSGSFVVTIAGRRYGKGSSREHSPMAEKLAGIRLVIAESFERLYRQNADNIGLFTSTDRSLLSLLKRGESPSVEQLVGSRESLAAAILRAGGLLEFGRRHIHLPANPAPMSRVATTPLTYAEKIIARTLVKTDVTGADLHTGAGAFVRPDRRFIVDFYTGMCTHMMHRAFGEPVTLHEPSTVLAFEDHLSYTHQSPAHIRGGLLGPIDQVRAAHRRFVQQYAVTAHGALPGGDGSEGISHPIVSEWYALPGQLIVGTDSHTTHSGALGALAFGVGATDMATALLTGGVRITTPPPMRIELTGTLPRGVFAKDVVLALLAHASIRRGDAIGHLIEFMGPVVRDMRTDERATLTNMTAEIGGFAGVVSPDSETVAFIRDRRGVTVDLAEWMKSDEGARYARSLTMDCSTLVPMVAAPGDPGNAVSVASLPTPIQIDIAYGGSCTGGKRFDFDVYHEVLQWARQRGLSIASRVSAYLQFGSVAVRDYCAERGYIETFEALGIRVLQPGCGACVNCGPGASTSASQMTISAINRNFPGRSGPGGVWLGSPATVASSAIAGEIVTFESLRARHSKGRPSA